MLASFPNLQPAFCPLPPPDPAWSTGRRRQCWTTAEDRSCGWRRPCTSRWHP